ncbi:MAG: hypothetical protein OES84_03570, partial [Kiritimatiellaceae bacterium]|nr:hypothetical protein [Kiritimatiellaceae bacterium]
MKRLAPYLGIALVVAVVLLPKLRGAHVRHTEFEAAMAQAEAENKCLFLAFTGSDWCDWCVKFESEIYTRPAFKQY